MYEHYNNLIILFKVGFALYCLFFSFYSVGFVWIDKLVQEETTKNVEINYYVSGTGKSIIL